MHVVEIRTQSILFFKLFLAKEDAWKKKRFSSLKTLCKEPKLKEKKGTKKFNYKLIFMENYICTNKLHASSI